MKLFLFLIFTSLFTLSSFLDLRSLPDLRSFSEEGSVAGLLCFYAISVSAQTVPVSMTGLELSVSAPNPVPGQNITITARSYNIDINSSRTSWSVDGKVVKTGIGDTILEIKAPALGKKTVITVTAVSTNGITVGNSVTISSGSVDMILETDGYTPPYFRGKLPIVFQNDIKITAIPHLANSAGVEYDPKNLIYRWQKNISVLEGQSGYGKQSITLAGDIIPRPYDISVTVSTRDGEEQAQGIIEVSPQSPFTIFYLDDPLYGTLFNNALGGTVRIGAEREVGVLTVPFGFNKPLDGIGGLTFDWIINGYSRPELSSNESVVLRAPDGQSGSSRVELSIKNTKKILQGNRSGFSAIFSPSTQNQQYQFEQAVFQ